MKACIALFRGINVGGKNALPMKDLVEILQGVGAHNIKTYIQSGNVVFESSEQDRARLSAAISSEIKRRHKFEPYLLLLNRDDIETAIRNNPFPEAIGDPRALHAGFLVSVPKNPDLEALLKLKSKSERFQLIDKVFYLHAPEGIGRSRLAASAERLLGVPMTDRNWRTLCKIRDLARS